MKKLNMNDVAILVTKREGKKKPLSIAQVKEVLKCLRQVCCLDGGVNKVVKKYLRLS
jgi:hypothetical protein